MSAGPEDRPAIEVAGLTKRFGDVTAVDGLSFVVPSGQVTGFLGPNGAGKTTTMRVVLGLAGATEGEREGPGRALPCARASTRSRGRDAREHRVPSGPNRPGPSARRGTGGTHRSRSRRRGARTSRDGRPRRSPCRRVLERHASTTRPRRRAARRPRGARARRAGQRARSRRGWRGCEGSSARSPTPGARCSSRATCSPRWRQTADRLVVIDRGRLVREGPVGSITAGRRQAASWSARPIATGSPWRCGPRAPRSSRSTRSILVMSVTAIGSSGSGRSRRPRASCCTSSERGKPRSRKRSCSSPATAADRAGEALRRHPLPPPTRGSLDDLADRRRGRQGAYARMWIGLLLGAVALVTLGAIATLAIAGTPEGREAGLTADRDRRRRARLRRHGRDRRRVRPVLGATR